MNCHKGFNGKCDQFSWEPIESAPRDGSKFLVTDGNHFSDARWPEKHILGRWEPRGDGYEYGGGPLPFKPTHWMPLSSLPPGLEVNYD